MTEAEIDEMVAIAKAAVDEVMKELYAQGQVAG
jgi:L-2,4-diaminobutyrate transaminase